MTAVLTFRDLAFDLLCVMADQDVPTKAWQLMPCPKGRTKSNWGDERRAALNRLESLGFARRLPTVSRSEPLWEITDSGRAFLA